MSHLYLIRHGEAAASWQENPDPGLSGQGRTQASQLAKQLDGCVVESILSSPMLRARETAVPLASVRGLPVQIEDRFREIPTPPTIALEDRLDWLRRCARQTWQEVDPLLVQWRAALLNTLNQLPGETAIFTHFMVMNAVVGHLNACDTLVSYQPAYCSVLVLERVRNGLRLADLGRQSDSRIL